LPDDTIAGAITLYGGVPSVERARQMMDANILSPQKFWPEGGFPVPTTALDSPWFNPQNYWLGPVWVNTNWMALHGLQDYGFGRESSVVRDKTLELVRRSGFREYFNPVTGEGYGTDSFSWSAALTIDLLTS
jgi:neutral trehalase